MPDLTVWLRIGYLVRHVLPALHRPCEVKFICMREHFAERSHIVMLRCWSVLKRSHMSWQTGRGRLTSWERLLQGIADLERHSVGKTLFLR